MANKALSGFEASYKKLQVPIAKYSAKSTQSHLERFKKSYKKCQALEGNLVSTLVPARKGGVTGSSLKDFKKYKHFAAVYKSLDAEVDELHKAQEDLKDWTNSARSTADDVKELQNFIAKEVKRISGNLGSAEQKQLDKLLVKLAAARKDLEVSGDLMKQSLDSRMIAYVPKFEKTIEKLLDLAPKVEGELDEPSGSNAKKAAAIPRLLQKKVLELTFRKAETFSKKIIKHCDTAVARAKIDPLQAGPEMKAARSTMKVLDKFCAAQKALQTKHAKFIEKLDEKEKAEMKKSFEGFATLLDYAKKQLTKTEKLIEG